MSAQEYGYWEAEYRRKPWGDYVVELGAGIVAANVANANRSSKTKPFTPLDYMPLQKLASQPADEEQEADPKEFFEGMNKDG